MRKIAKVRLVNSKVVSVFIPGEGHNISRFSDITIIGRRIRDLPGIKYGAVRGKMDLNSVLKRKNGRSKYGTKKNKPPKITKPAKQKQAACSKRHLYTKSLSNFFKLFLRDSDIHWFKTSRSVEMVQNLLLYQMYVKIKHLKSKKKVLEARNLDLLKGLRVKPKNLKKVWKETKNVISGIKRSISNKENLRRLDLILKKTKNLDFTSNKSEKKKFQKNHYELLEVSQTLRIIRVLDLKSDKTLRYPF